MSSRIANTFASLKSMQKTALIPFVMAGDPNLEVTADLLPALVEAGANIIELGVPFTDPVADGETIQAAGLRALKAGTTLQKILGLVSDFRRTNTTTPIVLMGYLNPIHSYGIEAFARDAAISGVDGLIIVDMPPEEADMVSKAFHDHGLDLIRLITPTTDSKRLAYITDGAAGFLYYVSIAGITGTMSADPIKLATRLDEIRSQVSLPLAVGFGIRTALDVAALKSHTDAVVVGSSLIAAFENGGKAKVMELVRQMAEAA